MAFFLYIDHPTLSPKAALELAFQTVVRFLFKLPTKTVDKSGESFWESATKARKHWTHVNLLIF